MNPDTTLADLGLDSLMGVEVKQTLERDHDLALSMKDIRLLTINKLKEIAGGKGESSDKDGSKPAGSDVAVNMNDSGISVRYDFNHIMPSEDMVHMNAITEGQPLFIIHPIEGLH